MQVLFWHILNEKNKKILKRIPTSVDYITSYYQLSYYIILNIKKIKKINYNHQLYLERRQKYFPFHSF